MKKSLSFCAVAMIFLFGQSARVAAQAPAPEREARAPEAKPAEKCDAAITKEESSVTDHTIRIGGQTIPYKATASTTLLKNDKGDPTGLLYSVAYTRSDVKDLTQRPVSFLYNGGPGSATMWLHMGAFGPRRAFTVDGTFTPPAPYKLVDNSESLLDKTDLVFIDAMGTGYSHAVCKAQEKHFYGIENAGLTTGRIDARFTGYTYDLLQENAQGDPEGPAVGGAFTALINAYNHDELKFGKDKVYHNTAGVFGSWNWTRRPAGGGQQRGGGFPGAPNVETDLAQAMITNPKLLVQVENGYYDFATPFFATEFTMEHLGLPEALQKNIKEDYYNAGHMMYLHDEDRINLHNQIAGFIDRATHQ